MADSLHVLVPKDSHIRRCIYEPDERLLRVTFRNHAVYHYEHVTADDFARLQQALLDGASLGRFLRQEIAPNHPVERVTPGLPTAISPLDLPPLPWRH